MNFRVSLFVFCLIMTGCSQNTETITTMKLSGDWMNIKYASVLIEHRSPRQASLREDIKMPFFEIRSTVVQYGVHEGNGFGVKYLKKQSNTDEYCLYDSKNKLLEHVFKFDSDSLNELTWIMYFDDEYYGTEQFFKIPDELNYWINEKTIAGNYIDENGKRYSFSREGKAVWPNKSFEYEMGLEYPWVESDFIYDWNNGTVIHYGFKWERGNLYFFDEVPCEGEMILFSKNPFAKLTKIE